MIIKRYNHFVKNKKVNEDVNSPDETISTDNEYKETENIKGKEEEGVYIGQKMIQDLADALGVKPNADGSVTYNGKRVNFYSETEKLHVDDRRFSTVEEVIDYLQMGESDERTEEKLESKSYKLTRKFKRIK